MVFTNRKDVLISGALLIVLAYLVFNVPGVLGTLSYILALLTPVVLGIILAFVINIPLRFFENRIFGFMGKRPLLSKFNRPIALIVVMLILLSIIALIVIMLLPQLVSIVNITIEKLPSALRSIVRELDSWGINISEYITNSLNIANTDKEQIQHMLSLAGNILLRGIASSGNIIGSVFSNVMSAFFVIMIVIYILLSKERLQKQFYKLLYSITNIKRADNIKSILKRANKVFTSFITGQCIEAAILGLLMFITMSIFAMPYALFISVLVAIFALIPIIGAWIAIISGCLLILTVNINQAFYFILLFIVVQTFEGNVIYPKVIGNAIGLPPLWILIAVVVGQSFFGIFGTLFLIPLTSLIYAIIDEETDKCIHNKGIDESYLH